ncbi:Hsp20/alpha crystallin family protein [Halalkalicoccus sp. NIPERK01]|uniref:Hsp20/alpha crystallin family protein n=1 Tax=Halalkalicoccus sp. NIPERK01 TaxID=3053469 RepID=UPI00256EAFD0|nr:Hsp20/alpha crystallin family protein [Halalkalicoccus sp. NIPERK01]MDL5363581.1 Hsp20/alpha crystallin family protein [Halalkalicoccus sp. NIPERK01]
MAMRRHPFEEMDRMMEQMRRSMWEGWTDRPMLGGDRRDVNLGLDTDDEGYVLLADMPGFEKEEIDLRFDDGVVSIEASHERDEGDDTVARRHTRYVREQVRVGDVIAEESTASYRNGVLEVHLPTRGEAADEGSRIDID